MRNKLIVEKCEISFSGNLYGKRSSWDKTYGNLSVCPPPMILKVWLLMNVGIKDHPLSIHDLASIQPSNAGLSCSSHMAQSSKLSLRQAQNQQLQNQCCKNYRAQSLKACKKHSGPASSLHLGSDLLHRWDNGGHEVKRLVQGHTVIKSRTWDSWPPSIVFYGTVLRAGLWGDLGLKKAL